MTEDPDDRRIQRTKHDLHNALMQLIAQKPFDKITVKAILERANVGRTTFYTHFQGKEDLFLSSHEPMIRQIARSFFSVQGDLQAEVSSELVAFLAMSQQSRGTYFHLTSGNAQGEIVRLLRDRIARYLYEQLQHYFQETESAIPFVLLAQQVAGSIVTLSNWWLEKRSPYSVHEIAALIHQMNYVVLRHALSK